MLRIIQENEFARDGRSINRHRNQGYHSITESAYSQWAAHKPVLLPSKPILLTVDDGIDNFFGAATPVLRHFGYNMVAVIVTGFATGAQNGQQPYAGFDASWTQLRQLDSSIWNFAFHAGAQGHLDFASQACPYYYRASAPARPTALIRRGYGPRSTRA
jgi:hypothetical protein